MKCPKCGSHHARYTKKRSKDARKKEPRTDFNAKCGKCKYEWGDEE